MYRSLNSEDWSIFAPLEGIMERMGLANLSILIQQASYNYDGSIQSQVRFLAIVQIKE